MNLFELFVLGVGLSMDAFAVAVCKGLSMDRVTVKKSCIVGAWFGGFQALMPLIGYFLGNTFSSYIQKYDHWGAFVLLGFIGFNMVRESREETGEEEDADLSFKAMLIMAVATSIDALAVGVTFAFLNVNVALAVTLIGITTFLFSVAGVKIGGVFGARFKNKAELAGGLILICLGLKILLEHLGIL